MSRRRPVNLQYIPQSRTELPHHHVQRPSLPELHELAGSSSITMELIKKNHAEHKETIRWGMETDHRGKSALEHLVRNEVATNEMIEYFVTHCPDSVAIGEGYNSFDYVLSNARYDAAKFMLSKASNFINVGDSVLRSIENMGTVKFLLKEVPDALQEVDHVLLFSRMFSTRNKNQVELFHLLVQFLGKDLTKKSLLDPSSVALRDFLKQCQDEYKHEKLVEDIYNVLGGDLFEYRDPQGNSVLHFISSSWMYGCLKCVKMMTDLDNDSKAFCYNKEKRTPLHTILKNGSLIHYEDGRGLKPLKLIIKKYYPVPPHQELDESDLIEHYIKTICSGQHGSTSRDELRDQRIEILELLINSTIPKEKKTRVMMMIGRHEIQDIIWQTGYNEIFPVLKRHGSDIRPEPFFDLKNKEISFSLGGTVVTPCYGYGAVRSYRGYDDKDPDEFYRMFVKIEKMSAKGGFVGCVLSKTGLSVYLGNSKGSCALRLKDGVMVSNKKEIDTKVRIQEGDIIECRIYPKKEKLTVSVNPRKKSSAGRKNNITEMKLESRGKGEKYHFAVGMFKETVIRVLERVWSMENHLDFPKSFREVIKLLLLVHSRELECSLSKIPKDVLIYILFKYINPFWF